MFGKKDSDNKQDSDLIVLRTASNNYELGLIEGLLEDHHIPFLVQDRGVGGYLRIYAGSSIYGTDIMVGKTYFDQAKAIMDEVDWDETSQVSEVELEKAAEEAAEDETE
ncbi:DUF2007 domain-containing protein [uncultured Robinsoniella sp.]|uniref:putative signal transducing protein n=1 Tax=uncultured Robinsoniella sp. TaxID=904190 RepID=UPI00374E24C0